MKTYLAEQDKYFAARKTSAIVLRKVPRTSKAWPGRRPSPEQVDHYIKCGVVDEALDSGTVKWHIHTIVTWSRGRLFLGWHRGAAQKGLGQCLNEWWDGRVTDKTYMDLIIEWATITSSASDDLGSERCR